MLKFLVYLLQNMTMFWDIFYDMMLFQVTVIFTIESET